MTRVIAPFDFKCTIHTILSLVNFILLLPEETRKNNLSAKRKLTNFTKYICV